MLTYKYNMAIQTMMQKVSFTVAAHGKSREKINQGRTSNAELVVAPLQSSYSSSIAPVAISHSSMHSTHLSVTSPTITADML